MEIRDKNDWCKSEPLRSYVSPKITQISVMPLLTKLMFTEVPDDIPRETSSPAWGHGLLTTQTQSPYGAVFYYEEINLFILMKKGLDMFY